MDESSFSSPQKRYGDYEILKPIGKGKFAVVYRARRVDSEEIVALKRINVDSIDDKAREKCLKEVRLLQSLDHPNVIRYLDSFITENDLVIVFEWAAAGDLKRQLRKAQERGVGFEERVIWKYFSQICDAIQHMHDRRIMHRDLKPANIFLTLDGTVKVGDLGLSRELSEHTVQAHSKVGTPLYMSPEVLRGDGYDFKSDIWSLGCLLYELAQLKSPFKSEGLNLYLLFQKISQGDYQPLPDHYSEELKTLAYAMISTKSEDRPEVSYVCSQARKMRALFNDRNAVLKRQQAQQQQQQQQQQQGSVEGTTSSATSSSDNPLPAEEKRSSGAGREAAPEKGLALANLDVMDSKTSQGGGSDASGQETPPMRVSQPQHAQRMQAADEEAAPKRASSRSAYNAQPSSPESDDKHNYNYQQQQPYRQVYTASAEQKASKPKAPVATHRAKPGIGSSASAYNAGPAVNSELNLDDADGGGGGGGGTDTSVLSGTSVAFALMDVVYDRLVVLGYPMEDNPGGGGGSGGTGGGKKAVPGSSSAVRVQRAPNGRGRLLPVHFACDLSLLGGVAGYDGKIAQYRRLVDVSVWLLSRVGGAAAQLVSRMDAERDSPITIAKQLLGAAQAAGVPQESLAEIVPTALTVGYGERVCAFLVALADAALKHSPATTEMRYEADNGLDAGLASAGQGGGGMRDDDGEIEDETGDVLGTEEDGAPQETESSLLAGGGDGEGSQSAAHHSVLMPAVDPALWREETERVAKQLAAAGAKLQSGTGSSWGEHLVTMQRIVRETYRQENKQQQQQQQGDESASSSSELADTRRSEGLVNSRQNIASLGVQFGTHQRDLADLEARAGGRQKALEERTEALAALDEKLADLTEALENKTSGDGSGGAGAGGGSMALREGIRKLKQDITEMTLTSALIDASLLQKRAAASSASRSRRTRVARANGKSRRGNDEADSMDRAATEWDDI